MKYWRMCISMVFLGAFLATLPKALALDVTSNPNQGLVYGVNGHAGWSSLPDRQIPLDQQMKKIADAGLKIYRFDIGTIDDYTIDTLKRVIASADKYGIQVLPVIIHISHGPDGILKMPGDRVATPEIAYDMGYSVGAFYARSFASSIPVFEVGNEYDAQALNGGADGSVIGHYNDYKYKIVSRNIAGMIDGIRSANPKAKTMVDYVWCHYGLLDQMWADGIRWDITGFHWYYSMNNGNPEAAGCWAGPTNLLQMMKTKYGKPIWITEFGDDVGAAQSNKPQMASSSYSMMERFTRVSSKYGIQAALMYELYDTKTLPAPEGRFGICDASGNCDNDLYRMIQWFTSQKNITTVAMSMPSGLTLDVSGGSVADGAPIIQYSANGGKNQQWRFVPVNGHYQIMSASSGKCMDVSGAKTAAGTPVIQFTCSGNANQLWDITVLGNGYSRITGVSSGRCLDVPASSAAAGTALTIWDCNGGKNQMFNTGF